MKKKPKTKAILRNKEGHYIIIKGEIQQKDISLVNLYASNQKHVKQISMDIKGEIDSNKVIVGKCSTTLISVDRSSTQKINKETVILYGTLYQMYI